MPFHLGDHVHVANFGKGIVREVRNGGRYRVELKARSMVVTEAQLSAVDARPRRPSAPDTATGVPASLARSHAARSIDLHGMTTEAAVAAVDAFLDDAIRAEVEEVQIIHGRSGGRVKAAVHARLRAIGAIRGFRVNPANEGVTIVSL